MNMHLRTLTIRLALSQYGDALIFGMNEREDLVPGLQFKQRLFAWHEASFYGTELTVQPAGEGVELVILPAEQVIPFFAEQKLLAHIEWSWEGDAAQLTELAPLLAICLEHKQYIPDISAYRAGRLQWTWDEGALAQVAVDSDTAKGALEALNGGSEFSRGLRAAFSAAVSQRYYSTEAEAGDLRSEFPLLFDRSGALAAGMDTAAWLIAIGWKADTAPFRPALQLLEPDEDESYWRLQLILQDKRDESALVPIRLADNGEPYGLWPAAWSAHVHERAAGWLERLRGSLPPERFAAGGDVLAEPLSDAIAWRFLTAESQRLLEAGWQVLLPAWWEAASRKSRACAQRSAPAKTNAAAASRCLVSIRSSISIGESPSAMRISLKRNLPSWSQEGNGSSASRANGSRSIRLCWRKSKEPWREWTSRKACPSKTCFSSTC